MRREDIAIVAGALILVILFLGVLGGGAMMGWGPMGPGMMGWAGYGGNPWGWIMMLLFWGLVIGGIALLFTWAIRGTGQAETPAAGPSRALDILKERYARGEISRELYEQMLRDLK